MALFHAKNRTSSLRWRSFLALLFLSSYLLFCHGCHGDEDNELFTGAHCGSRVIYYYLDNARYYPGMIHGHTNPKR